MLLKFTPRASVLPSQPDRSTTLRSRPKKQSPTRTFCCQTPKHVHTAKRGHGLMEAHSAAPESAARFLSSKRLYAWQVTPQLLNPPHSTTAMTRTGPRPQRRHYRKARSVHQPVLDATPSSSSGEEEQRAAGSAAGHGMQPPPLPALPQARLCAAIVGEGAQEEKVTDKQGRNHGHHPPTHTGRFPPAGTQQAQASEAHFLGLSHALILPTLTCTPPASFLGRRDIPFTSQILSLTQRWRFFNQPIT